MGLVVPDHELRSVYLSQIFSLRESSTEQKPKTIFFSWRETDSLLPDRRKHLRTESDLVLVPGPFLRLRRVSFQTRALHES
jgi:hypothetical protein